MERSGVYGFLAEVFRAEPSPSLLRELRSATYKLALEAAGVKLDSGFYDGPEKQVLDDLAVEYTQLFIGPGRHTPPFASVYLDGEGASLWEPSTGRVRNFIEETGFAFSENYSLPPDHLSVELEFMQRITAREARGDEEEDDRAVDNCRAIEEEFLDGHLGLWAPLFCRKVTERARLPFYREMAELTRTFIASEVQALGGAAGHGLGGHGNLGQRPSLAAAFRNAGPTHV
jgi:TorA maturation chaperone TorD